MEIPDDLLGNAAKRAFGLDYLYPYQRLVAANVLDSAQAGAEALRQVVLLPTGFGKSLCFQLPALFLPGPTLVIYPLLALMEDQRRRLDSLGIGCALFRGGQSPEEREAAESAVESGSAKIVITNPECLCTPRLLAFLKNAGPSHVAIDEAHCVSEWGESFRPSYLELGRILEKLAPPALSAFTATASPLVFEAVARVLFGEAPYRVVEGDPDRPNISYAVVRTLSRDHSLSRLARELPRPLIVFCSSREGAQMLARLLSERLEESEVRFYHAGLEKPEKKAIEEWFLGSERGILCSTCAYGMGVDKKNIRSVIHYEAPASIEAYLQEAGRAGRDGLPARAILLSGRDDASRSIRDATNNESDADEQRRSRFRALLGYASSEAGCRRDRLLDLLGTPREGRAPCSGCDRCEALAAGEGERPREGEDELLNFARANARRFTAEEALGLLRGKEAGSRVAPKCALWGAMAEWEAKDAARAMDEAIKAGTLRILRGWFWKDRIAPQARYAPGASQSIMPSSSSSGSERRDARDLAARGAGLGLRAMLGPSRRAGRLR